MLKRQTDEIGGDGNNCYMKLVVQRVEKAKVIRVSDQKIVGEIGRGLFVLVGMKKGDSEKDI